MKDIQTYMQSKQKSQNSMPRVSVITVVYNSKDAIEKTIRGVLEQTYPNIEYVVIDGGSNDGTVDIIKKYEGKIDYFISEKDTGVYDAMNKGIEQASGEWINFMNAGDTFCDEKVIENILLNLQDKDPVDLIYGDAIEITPQKSRKKIIASVDLSELWKGAKFGHESLFTRASIIKKNKFDLSYRVSSDYDFIMKCFSLGYTFKKINIDVLLFSPPGFSRDHWIKATLENWNIARKNKKEFKVDLYYASTFLFSLAVKIFKQIMPMRVYIYIKKIYYTFK